MKILSYSLSCLLFSLIILTQVYAGSITLKKGEGIIDRVDRENYVMVVGDGYFKVSEKVKVHSQFIKNDYFSRLKKGMKIKYTFYKKAGHTHYYINEIWVQ